MGERFGAEETDAGNVGVGRWDKRIGYVPGDGLILEKGNRLLDVGIGRFSAEEAEDFAALGGVWSFCGIEFSVTGSMWEWRWMTRRRTV